MNSRRSNAAKFPRINLPRANADRMFLSSRFPSTNENAALLEPLLGGEEIFFSGTPYTSLGKKHLITASVGHPDGEVDHWVIRIEYDATDFPDEVSVPREDRREAEFLSACVRLSEVLDFSCNTEFRFLEVEDSALWFPLPSEVGGTSDGTGTFLIVGVQAVARPVEALAQEGYGFNLTRSPDWQVGLDLYYRHSQRFAADLPKRVLDRGLSIANQLVGSRPTRKRSAP